MITLPEQKKNNQPITAAVIVAHPDDEALWAGGTILLHPEYRWCVTALCRAGDIDRAPKFFMALQRFGASGNIANLDDSPEQFPLPIPEVQKTILSLLPANSFDLLFTHGPRGEYTYHRRHIEVFDAVAALLNESRLFAEMTLFFAYEDGGGKYLPRPEKDAHLKNILPEHIWQEKYKVITEGYTFDKNSWEAQTTPREESFWCFTNKNEIEKWLKNEVRKK